MDTVKIGKFLQQLRKDRGLTQEQLAEQMGVVRRTVSRWETGSNMPDLDILIELSDFHAVDLREILSGERKSEHMNKEMKETVLQVAEYSNEQKQQSTKVVQVYFVLGIIALLINAVISLMEISGTFWIGALKGTTIGLSLGSMILGLLFTTGKLDRIRSYKMRLLRRGRMDD